MPALLAATLLATSSHNACAQSSDDFAYERIQAVRDALHKEFAVETSAQFVDTANCSWSSVQSRIAENAREHNDHFLQWISENPPALRNYCCVGPDIPNCWEALEATHIQCCYQKLAGLLQHPPAWVVAEVEQQRRELQNVGWNPASLTRMEIDRFSERLANLPTFRENEGPVGFRLCRFRVVAGEISACDVAATPTGDDDVLLNALTILQNFAPLPDLDFFVSTTDVEHSPWEIPVFTKQRPAGMRGAGLLLLPHEFLLTTWNRKMELVVNRATKTWPWADKMDKVFWRGGGTAQWMCGNADGSNCTTIAFSGMSLENLAMCPRGRVVLLSSLSPGDVDAKFSRLFDTKLQDAARRWGWLDDGGRPAHEDFFAYKYLWNDEHTDAMFWRLRGNSLQFLTMGQYTHWLLPHGATLRPFEHFLPVRHDQSNLLELLHWAREHDEEAKRIAEAAANMMDEMLDPESGPLAYLHALLLMYAELQAP